MKLTPGESLEKNTEMVNIRCYLIHGKLNNVCEELLQAIVRSIDKIPASLRYTLSKISDLVAERFPEHKRFAVTSLIFLRFFCTAICTPEHWNIIPTPVYPVCRRAFIIIAQTMQCLGNYVRFSRKEAHMALAMNSFIERSEPILNEFVDKLCVSYNLLIYCKGSPKYRYIKACRGTSSNLVIPKFTVTESQVREATVSLMEYTKSSLTKIREKVRTP